ncbi:MAG: glycosyltransferase [Oscillospiraceae bacterium]|nr:glycosyltransferase [Oscillospiraceae bacterium]
MPEPFRRIVRETPKITLVMLTHNEAARYLRPVVSACLPFIDNAVVLDDASTDDTVMLLESLLQDIPHRIVVNEENMFSQEGALRQKLWRLAVESDPDWMLLLDADEILEDGDQLRALAQNSDVDLYSFRLYDMWSATQYRSDALWCAHTHYFPRMLRYHPLFPYQFSLAPQHCGTIPLNAYQLPNAIAAPRIRHMGWANPDDRQRKYERYMLLDPEGRYGSLAQYASILDAAPHLELFEA